MKYLLEKALDTDLDRLKYYKLDTILKYAKNLEKEEIDKIKKYVETAVVKELNNYKVIKINNDIVGCLLLEEYLDGILIDEIYIEEKYRNKKIGSDIIKNVLDNNKKVYLWVYKANIRAYKLYKSFGFSTIEETESRYLMEYK